ncbi:remorin-like [Rhodamnia argentea]|uniref:Remorin-like n=1 Tax=Rhodamnia argentea TaxID=178133 RepID=A0A8B8QWV0_9MYRT|nr:remorin-like [Rhodamnia argentea]
MIQMQQIPNLAHFVVYFILFSRVPVAKLKDYVMEEEVEKEAGRTDAPEAPPEPENGAQEKIVISAPNKKVAFVADDEITDAVEKGSGDQTEGDGVLAQVETEKRLALIRAWEESEKSKAESRAYKKLTITGSWENTQIASVEARIKEIEEETEKKKAEQAEKIRNRLVEIHKEAEVKKATIEVKRGEDIIKVQEAAAKFRATGYVPRKLLRCFGS